MSLAANLRIRLGALYRSARPVVVTQPASSAPSPPFTLELPEQRFAFCVDRCVSPDPTSLFLRGWLWDPARRLARLELVLGTHTQTVPTTQLMRFPRKDVAAHCITRFSDESFDNHGFLIFLPTAASTTRGGVLRVVLNDSPASEFLLHPAVDPFLCQRHILDSIPPEPFFDAALMADHIRPALERTRSTLPRAGVGRTVSFGSTSAGPEISIIVPLYRRLELMEHQLAQFSNDPAISSAELVYVLDDPSMAPEFEFYAFHLAQLYRVPFKAVIMERHAGYSAANNAGVSASTGSFLLFLNSDVFPTEPGWTTQLLAFHKAHPDVGALGCKLLYEDFSIQHAGMYFYQGYHPHKLWVNMHYFKGLPREWAEACVDRVVPAVTGAALLARRSVFEEVGGWDESYVLANYEDSDLCLRLVKNGYTNRYCSSVELYHLERQSQQDAEADPVRVGSDFYNRWLQTFRWDALIENLMKQHKSVSIADEVRVGGTI